jgi:hypothetical protein
VQTTYSNEPTPPHVAAMGDHFTVTLHFSTDEMRVLGAGLAPIIMWLATFLNTLISLRTGWAEQDNGRGHLTRRPVDAGFWYWSLNDLHSHLLPHLRGVRDAAIRAHHGAGGSINNLSLALGVAKSTAQYRRDQVVGNPPDNYERWATDGVPQPPAVNLTQDID